MKKPTIQIEPFQDFIFRTCGKRFREYYAEMDRHEQELKRIYGDDKLHICKPEETGCINQVTPKRRLIVTFYRCALCLRDMTQKEVDQYRKKHP